MTDSKERVGPLKPGHGVPNIPEDGLAIFTDGSMLSKPRRKGGFGFVLVWTASDGSSAVEEVPGQGFTGATNNQMEVKACAEALRYIQQQFMHFDLAAMSKVVIFTDSIYVRDNYQAARYQWKPYWVNRDGGPVSNAPEWKEFVRHWEKLDRAGTRLKVEFAKGHNVLNPFNKAADKLATRAAKNAVKDQLRPVSPGRKITSEPTIRGSVKMEGQEITIRIIGHSTDPFATQTSYRYEVMDAESRFDGRSDVITSRQIMHRSHLYRVRLNSDQKNPWVLELIAEVSADGTPVVD